MRRPVHTVKIHVQNAIQQSRMAMWRRQRSKGSFSYCCEVSPLSDAIMVIFLELLGETYGKTSLLCQSMLKQQRRDGAFVAYADQSDNISISSLCYLALRLGGYSKSHPALVKAEGYIRQQGGLTKASNLAKIYLCAAGQVPWSALPQIPMTGMLFSQISPVNLYDFASFTRVHIPSILILSNLQFRISVANEKSITYLLPSGTSLQSGRLQSPPNHNVISHCRHYLLTHMESNGTLAGYVSSTTMAVFALLATGMPKSHPVIQAAIQGLKGLHYDRGQTGHQQLFSSTIWDTALSMQALQASGKAASTEGRLQKSAAYLLRKQQVRSSDWIHHAPGVRPGGWGFSQVNQKFPDLDDTIACLEALKPYRSVNSVQWQRGYHWVLGMQNSDGGWSAFDKDCNKAFLEKLALNDMGRAVTDPSTADMTGRVLSLLKSTGVPAGGTMRRGANWLLQTQRPDGSWFGRWGIAFLYGTAHASEGLAAAGVPTDHPTLVRARTWLESVQNADGGFGESCQSDAKDVYCRLGRSIPSQTAWGLLGLMASSRERTDAIDAAALQLVKSCKPKIGWTETYPTGAGVAGQAYIRYHSYPLVWPTIALAKYETRFGK
jgi:sporulenol synthase